MKVRRASSFFRGLAGAALAVLSAASWAQETPPPAGTIFGGPGSASAGGAAVPVQASNLPDLGLVGWAIPQIRWGGNTGSTYVFNTDFLGQSSLSSSQLMSGRASSFIYAPWFAQVTANAGLSTNGSQNSTAGTKSKADSTAINYGGNLNLFPLSRFPFSAYLDFSDSRAKANSSVTSATAESKAMRMGARQYYRPEKGSDSYNASVDRSVVTNSNAKSIVNALQGTYSTNIEDHSLSFNTRFSNTTGDTSGQGSTLFGASGNHSWRIPDEGLTINSSLNFSHNDIKSLSTTGNGLLVNNSQVFQAASSFSWLPDEDLPLTITGGAGFLNTATATDTNKTSLVNLQSFVNASYRISNNLQANAGATIASTSATNTATRLPAVTPTEALLLTAAPPRLLTSSQIASISYSGDPLMFESVSYNWGTGVNISNQYNSIGDSVRTLGGTGQHGVNTSISLSDTSILALNASQSVSLNASGSKGANNQIGVLGHNVGAVWRVNAGQASVAMLTVNASDTISSGAFSNHLRNFAGNGNFQTQLSNRASLSASVNINVSQQLSAPLIFTSTPTDLTGTPLTTTAPTSQWTGSGQISYSHRSPFDISNLMYTINFMSIANQTNLRVVSGDPNALSWQIAKVLSQQATYRIGRLSFQATASVAWAGDGKKNASIFGSVSREIGDF